MRKNWMLLALMAAAPTGCVGEPKAAEANPSGKAEKSAAPDRSTQSPLPKPDRHPPTSGDDTDPVISAAQIASTRVADHEERIDAALTELNDDLRTLSGGDHRAVDLNAEKLLALVQLLRKSGERIAEKYPKVKADLAGIVKASANVKVGYGRAKELYLEKAALETGDIKERYLALADLCDTFVRTNTGRTAHYAAFAGDLDKAVAKVARHVQFLTDFEGFLKLHPATSGAKDREDFMNSLNAFAEQILKFGDVLRLFRDKARDGAVSKKLQAEHDRALAAREKPVPAETVPQAAKKDPVEVLEPAVARKPVEETPPARVEAPAQAAEVRYVPVCVTRCVPTLVPVVYYHPCGFGCRRYATAVTHYEWRNTLVTETVYSRVCQ